ncbi:CoA transferase [soil metagenome]
MPLDGLVVVHLSQLAQGPFATQILGDMGAEVVKVEPLKGDWMRRFALSNAYPGGESISFLSFNRNKRSIAVDAKAPEGRAIIRELIAKADIVVENFRPGVMDRLGLGYEGLSKTNPRLILCSSSGYGQSGPYVTRPGQDLLVQALTGLPLLNGRRDDPPVPVGLGIADLVSGLHIVYGVLAALVQRSTTGLGQKVEVNLLNSLLSLQMQEFTAHLNGYPVPPRHANASSAPHVGPPFGIYPTLDGFLAIAMNPMDVLGPLLGLPPEYCVADMNVVGEETERLFDAITVAVATRTTQDWLDVLLAADIWCAPVQDYDAVENDPQIEHNGMIGSYQHPTAGEVRVVAPPIVFGGGETSIRRPAPLLGQHSRELLDEYLGRTPEQISALIASGVVGEREA